jgi:JmjC domain
MTSILDKILSPLNASEFLKETWGTTFAHTTGEPDRFHSLMSWKTLNHILSHHHLDFPQLHIIQEGGETLPAHQYTRQVQGRRSPQQIFSYPDVGRVNRLLQDGATMVIDNVNDLHAPIKQMAFFFEQLFHARVLVNAWVACRPFMPKAHWDGHDMFVLQVEGRKRWTLYAPPRSNPVQNEWWTDGSLPEAAWSQVLQPGDLLYLPRGWMHEVTPINEPSLHLSVGIFNLTGIDLLQWLIERLRTSSRQTSLRSNLPLFSGPQEQQTYLLGIKNEITEILDCGAPLLAEYVAFQDENAGLPVEFSFPYNLGNGVSDLNGETVVSMNLSRRPEIRVNDQYIELRADGKIWKFSQATKPILDLLAERDRITVGQLYEELCPEYPIESMEGFIKELVSSGLVKIVY